MQGATEKCHYPELVGEPLRLELNYTFPLKHKTELTVLGKRTPLVAVDKLGFVGKKFKMDIFFYAAEKQPFSTTHLLVAWFFSL